MISNIAGQAFQVGIFPLSGPVQKSPLGFFANLSALRYQSGIVLIIGPGTDTESLVSQCLLETNFIILLMSQFLHKIRAYGICRYSLTL